MLVFVDADDDVTEVGRDDEDKNDVEEVEGEIEEEVVQKGSRKLRVVVMVMPISTTNLFMIYSTIASRVSIGNLLVVAMRVCISCGLLFDSLFLVIEKLS